MKNTSNEEVFMAMPTARAVRPSLSLGPSDQGATIAIAPPPLASMPSYYTITVPSSMHLPGVEEWPNTPQENRRRDFWRNLKNDESSRVSRPKKLHWNGSRCKHVLSDGFTFDRILEGDDFNIASEELPTAVCVTCLNHFNEA